MSELKQPLRARLDQRLSEQDVRRLWQGIEERRGRTRARRRAGPLVLLAAALLAVALLLPMLRAPVVATAPPLRTLQGQPLSTLRGTERASQALSDGSHLELSARAELDVLNNDGKAFVTVLRRGSVLFDVRPGGPRRWTIETGLGSVEVLGTRFRIDKRARSVGISVEHGVVMVRAESLPGRERRLTAGQALQLGEPARDALLDVPTRGAAPDGALLTPSSDGAPRASGSSSAPEQGSTRTPAPPASLPNGDASDAVTFDELLQRADRARAQGNRDLALEELRRAMAHPAADSRRALAAFSAGKLLLDAGRAHEAARAFEICLRSSPPAALAEDALVRRIEAEVRAGRLSVARTLAAEYVERHPRGSRREEVERWVGATY